MPKIAATRIDREIGARIRAARHEAGLSMRDLGNATGMTAPALQRWEQGEMRVRASMLVKFAKALNKSISYFYGEARV
jgi:transcriptional regulator with XRE-family HTH domain